MATKTPQSDDEEVTAPAADLPIPEWWMEPADVENSEFQYSARAPGDWVISGPLGATSIRRGRRFMSWRAAEMWARDFYGTRFNGRVAEVCFEGSMTWAFHVKGS